MAFIVITFVVCGCLAGTLFQVGAESNEMFMSKEVNMNLVGFDRIPTELLKQHNNMTSLHFQLNDLQYIDKGDFPKEAVQQLRYINLQQNKIHGIHEDAFIDMPHLLEVDLSRNKLTEVPVLKAPLLRRIILGRNQILSISAEAMKHYKGLEHLNLQENKIETIRTSTFAYNKNLFYLKLSDNPLKEIDEKGLIGPNRLTILDLENTLLTKFPSDGISTLEMLNIKKTPNLFTIPEPSKFKELKEVEVTYSMHCCAFRAKRKLPKLNGTRPCNTTVDDDENSFMKRKRAENASIDDMFGDYFDDMIESYNVDASNYTKCSGKKTLVGGKLTSFFYVKCTPEPDAFNPCQDVMGSNVLRAFSWIVAVFAIIGNIFQLVILFHSRQKSVYKILVYNLGFSNLLMGIYLLVLCCVDAYTYGEYYNYVRSWQYQGGCQAFGFFAVFATSLSVCSLILITAERFLLIIFALQSGYQLRMRHAKYCVVASWVYSFIVAVLPSTNMVSSYSKTAICLPMDIETRVSEGYVFWLLITYVLAFLLIAYLYVRMHGSIKDARPVSTSQNQIDTKVAKRMALIIFSNFLCWLPITIAGLIAIYGNMLFNVSVAKFLLVFIFPLNACTNPFLYAIFTRVFRDDTISLLSTFGVCVNKRDDSSRERAPSYFKGGSRKQGTNASSSGRHFLHIQRVAGAKYGPTENTAEQTEFDSPETPIKMMIDPNEKKCERGLAHVETPPLRFDGRTYEDVKPRSDSTRGLLEEYRKRVDAPCSESTETSSTGMSLRSAIEVEDNFADMIGSVNKSENSILFS